LLFPPSLTEDFLKATKSCMGTNYTRVNVRQVLG
jgi:hypothetical protein